MNYEFETINCDLCGSNDYEEVSQKGKFGLPTNVVLCKNCGLGYLNPRWNRKSYLHFYQYEYDKYYRPKLTQNLAATNKTENPIINRLEKFKLFPDTTNAVLDIGSGEGLNLRDFKYRFPEIEQYAIEPSIESQKLLKKDGVTIIGTDIDDSWNSEYAGKFDIIIMRHVLEHFMSAVGALKKINTVLSESGVVYIAVPNNLSPTQNLEQSWFRNVHTYYHNRYTLKNLLELTNFETIKLIEGDEYNKGEVFLIAKKSTNHKSPTFSNEHFSIQNAIFKDKLRQEKRITYKGVVILKKVAQKLFSLTAAKKAS